MIAVVICGILLVFAGSLAIASMALKPVGKAKRIQTDFTSDASHELRTPLAVIQTNMELVLENETVSSPRKWLMNIMTENMRMSKLVEDLLTLTRSDNGRISINVTRFLLNDALPGSSIRMPRLPSQKDGIKYTNEGGRVEVGVFKKGRSCRNGSFRYLDRYF